MSDIDHDAPLDDELDEPAGLEIAVIGMACRFPGAEDVETFWKNLRDGVESIHPIDDDELRAVGTDPEMAPAELVKVTRRIEGIDRFDAPFFGLSPREAEVMDPQQRLFLQIAWQALEDAGYDPEQYDGSIGVYAGGKSNGYVMRCFADPRIVTTTSPFQIQLGNDKDFLAARVSYKLDLGGPSVAVQTAGSTSLVACHVAAQNLLSGDCDMALAGAVAIDPDDHGYRFREGDILSPDGHVRALSADADGTVFGNGLGVLVLKRLEDALDDGDTIHAVLRGSAVNNDGSLRAGFSASGVDGQARVLRGALMSADVEAASVGYVETFGTGTPDGDAIEITALGQVYGKELAGETVVVGTAKNNVGHLAAASGMVGLIKAIKVLQTGEIPPTILIDAPHPLLAKTPLELATETTAYPDRDESPRRVAVSSFGLGGQNAHVVLEEAPEPDEPEPSRPVQLLRLSARTTTALERRIADLKQHLERHPELELADIAHTLDVGRRAFEHRAFVVGADHDEILAGLAGPIVDRAADAPPVALLCPDVGNVSSVAPALYEHEEAFREVVDTCADHLESSLGVDLRDVLSGTTEPSDEVVVHAGSFVVGVALDALWRSWGVTPSAYYGTGLGAWTAAHLAGVFALESALDLVVARARLLSSLDDSIRWSTAMMDTALTPFAERVVKAAPITAEIPLVSSASGTWIGDGEATDASYWAKLLRVIEPDDAGAIETLRAGSPTPVLLDLGPGTTFANLVDDVPMARVDGSSDDGLKAVLTALGTLFAAGVEIDSAAFWGDEARRRIPLPTYPFDEQRYWIEPVAAELFATEAPVSRDRVRYPRPDLATAYVEPSTATERIVAIVVADVLGLERVGAHDDFFALGGNSLLATQVVTRLRDELGTALGPQEVLSHPDVARLAAAADHAVELASGLPPIVATERVPRADGAVELPLSFAQERLWFLAQLEPDSPAYNIPVPVRFRGAIDVDAMATALTAVVERHEALRTVFAMSTTAGDDEIPVQVVLPTLDVPLTLIEVDSEAALTAALIDEARHPFDLQKGPLVRARLVRRAADDHVLMLNVHHIVYDGWSVGVLVRELTAFMIGRGHALPPLVAQYGDVAVWQRMYLAPLVERQLAWWREQLAGVPVLALPTDRPRPPMQTWAGDSMPVELSAATTTALDKLARAEGGTLFMALLGVVSALLARWSGQDDFAIGAPIANRTRVEMEPLIGFFVNTLVLRTDLSGDPSFRELLGRTKRTTLAAYAHQDVPFERLVAELAPTRDMAYQPLFQVMLTLQNQGQASKGGGQASSEPGAALQSGAMQVGGLSIERVTMESATAKFDLSFSFVGQADGLRGGIEWNTDLFDHATIERFRSHFVHLIEAVVAAVDQPLSTLDLRDAEEIAQLESFVSGGPLITVPAPTIEAWVARQAEATPDALAVADTVTELTYDQLMRRSRQLARVLRELGVGPEVCVGVCMDRSVDLVMALMAIFEAGGAYVALDPAYPAERLGFILEDAGAPVVITRDGRAAVLPEHNATVLDLADDPAADRADTRLGLSMPAERLAYLIYTSGSTGRPKGVAIAHPNTLAMLGWAREHETAAYLNRTFFATSINFDISIYELFAPLITGGAVIVGDDALALIDHPHRDQVTLINTVPSAMAELARMDGVPPTVRVVNLAGEPLYRQLAEAVYAAGEIEGLYNLYGPSEDTTYSTFTLVRAGVEHGEPTIGRPLAGTRAHVLDKHLAPTPIGVGGELYLAGAGVSRGYLARPSLTAERYVPDPFATEPGSRLYRTGDRVRWRRDGELLFEGRLDHQVKIRGFRIELGEIEAVLLDLPEVYEAVVMPRGPKQEQQLVAWLARNDGGEEYAAIRGALEERLPGYMVPASFVVLDALPRLPNGKVDRKALPEPSRQIETVAYVAPRTASEAAVASAVGAILGVDTVGVHDDFFALGGHSLLATRLVSRLRAELEVELPLRQVFATSDVAGLAAAVDQVAGRVALPPITHIERAPGADGTVELPLSFAQERLWFLAQLEPDSPAYNIPAPVRLRGALDVEALESALTRVVARHEALRTVFRAVDETPVQVVLPTLTVPIELVDVESDEAMLAALKRAVGTPFDLGTGPLIRAHLFRRADDDHVLVLNVHHIVYDGWSVGILVREVTTFLAGRGESLPALAVQYGDVALWQREHLAPLVEDQMAWWREQLAGIPVLELPTDRPRPPVQTWAGDSMPMALSAAGSTALEALAREESTTLFMALLGAASALLSRWSGQDDFAIGSPIANRTRAEMEPLIGFFVNTLVLRTDVSGDPSFRELLARMKHTTLDAYAHQDVPFERLVAELAPSRDMAYQPLFQVMLTLQNLGAPDAGVTATSEIEPETSGSETDAATDRGAVSLEPVSVPSTTAKFDLSLSFAGHPDGIRGQVEWNTDLFDRQSIERFALAFDRLVHAATAEPDLPLSRLPWLEEEVRETRLTPPVAVTLTPPATIHERVFAHTVRRADAIAVSDATGTWTYGELVDRARRLASRLRAVGVGTETRVGLCLERGASITEAILGVLAAGGAYVPLDPSAPAERLAFILADAEIVVLITTSDLDLELDFTGTTIELDTLDPSAEVANAPVVVDPDQVAYVIYTSGSTGTPKGTPVTHRNVLRLFQTGEEHFAFGPDDVWTLFHSYAFDFSVWEIWGALLYGGRLVVVPWATSRDPEAFHRLLVDERVTVLNQTPSAFRQLLTTIEVLDADPDVLALREVIFGGEALELAALRPWFDRFGARVRMVNMYGITETTVHVTFRAVTPEDLVRSHLSPIGEALSDLAIYLLDRELQPAYDGAVGEIWVAGDGLARGYLGRPALTAERFVPDPYSGVAGARLYRSGDLARFSVDGELVYVGRADFQVKIRGFRIELGEIEASLSAHDDVDQAAVLVRGDEGDERLVAYLVPSTPGDEPDEAGPVDIAALRAHLAAALPEYMVPAAFLVMPSFPLTVNGKLDRKALPEPGGFERGEARFVAPRTATEISVAAVMADVLGVDQVGVHDDFFALGGHSLLATRLVARLRGELDLELPLRQVFTTPDVAGLAAAVDQASGRVALPPIRPVERRPEADGSVFLPLSFAQERLWFLAQLEPDSPAYNIPAPVRLRGALDIDALTAALNIVVSRHEALRTVFRELDGTPRQVVLPELAITIPVTDITVEDEIDSDDQLRTALVTEASTPFDLEHGPLLRARVYRFAADDHVLMLNVHHIVYDGWSVGLLVREIVASLADRPAMLPPLAVQYGDVAAWQHEHLAPLVDEQVQWWREQLAGVPVLELPTDRPRPAMQTWAGDSLPVMLSNEATTKLESLVREEGGTLFMALLGAVSVVLARWSGQVDFAVGAPIANRTRIEMEPLIGFFVNTLVLRADLDGEPTFRELLGRWKHTTLEAYAHQDVPFERLVAELAPARDMAHAPLFQVMLTLQNLGQPGPGSIGAEIETDSDADGVRLEPVTLESKTAKFDLSLSFSRQPDGLRGAIEWNTDLFDRATIERLGAHFVHLVEAAVEQPDRKARLLPLESIDSYRERVGVTTAYPRDSNIVEQFRATVAAHPDSIVLVTDEVELRRDELARRACRVARRLHAMGVGPDTPVAVFTERSVDMVVAMLGILGAGGCYVPFDPNDPDERLAWIAEDTGIQLALVTPALASRLPTAVEALAVETLSVETDAVEAGSDDAKDDPWPDVEILPDSLSNVIYTSGSTGRPKGVMVSHRNVLRLVLEADYADLGPDETFVQLSSPAFDVTTLEVWAPLLSGSRLVLPPPGVLALEEIGALLARHQISTLWLTAGLFHQMVDHRLDDLRGVRQLLAGGEALSVPHVERVLAELGETTMINGYGPTENTTFTTCHRMMPGSELDAATVPIGTPIADTTVHVLDADLRPVPIGVPGELVTGGDGVARGYLRRPRLTATVFIPDPFATTPGARLYRTGDRARWRDDGTLEFFGRIDRQIKLRGFRIEPGEIETALVSHPAVHTAVVLVREDQPGDRRLVAYVVVEEQATVDQPSLMTHLRPLVPSYMVPAAIVVLDELPLNRSGKVDRRALPAPDLDADRAVYVAPRTPTEAVVANAIAAVLGVERVGVHDEFFALGGHSLLATRLISRLRTDLDVELPLRQVFATPDVAGLATAIEQAAGRVALPSIVATPREAAADGTVALPLSFAQERLWFLAQLDPESPAYNIPAPVRLRGALDVDALRAALTAVVTRHEVLRTVFRAGDETPVQVVLPATEVPLPVIDVASEAELFSHLRDEVSTAFDLEAGPLLRARLYHLGPDENVLLLNVHHIVYDGWSVGVLIRELGAHFAGLESRLPTLEVQYGDVAVWQREHLATSVDEQVAWWRTQLAGVPVLSLPTDRPRPPVQTFAGASLDFTVPAATSTALEDLARSHGATLFMVLHAGVSALLARWSGQDDFAIGSPIANRTRAEMEPLIGFFVNTLVLRTDLADDPSFVTLLERSKHTTLEAYGRQDVPFERLVAELSPTRDMAHTPLFQVLLILQNMARQTTTAEAAPSEFGALTLEPVRVGSTTAKFDVTLSFGEHPEGLRGQIEWNTDLFDRGTIERLIGQLVRLFTAVVETPETTVSALRLHDDAERHRLLVAYNDTTRDYPRDATVLDLVRARADATPDKIAVHAEGDDEGLSYRALIDRVHRVANKLRTLGVGPETLTGIYLERSADLVVATLAVHAAGGGYVPLDPAFPTARLAYVAEDAGLRAVITESALADDVPVAEEVPRFEIDTAKLGRTSKTAPAVPTRSDGLAYVIYTSGSTGKPKGVAIQHQALVNFLVTMADAPGLGVDDVLVALTTLSFDISGLELFLPLITGAQVVVANRETASDGARLGALLTTSGATVVQATPATWRLLLDSGWRPAPGLKVLCGGEALPRELADQLLAAGVELWNVYGPTETTIWSTCHRVEAGAGIPSIGRPIANTTIYTLDRHLEPTPIGVPGALMIGGDGLARGYYGRPALTAERFVPDPFAATPGARLYHTGDLARWRGDGTLDFLGRSDFQVKVRGFRIELGEIETVLDRHPAIARAVVNAVGSGADTALAAYLIVEADDGLPATSDLRRHLKESLPDYMVPAHYVELDAFPLTPNGKVDRRALPEPSREAALAAYVAPRTPTEVAVANAIATVLGVEKVGVHDDFFALGGHSLLATRFLARLRAELDVDLPLRQVFATPDVAGLALAVENAERVVLPPLEPVPRDRPVPATFAQERQWFLDRFRPGDTSYNLVNTLQLGSAIEHEALQAALDATVARHEILRTTFQAGDKAPVQVIHERLEIPVVFEDLRQLAPDEAATAVEAHANQERRRVFDLATGPLLALRLLRVADERSMLVLNMHHIISDGWSMMVLMREIAARMAGQTPPPLAVQIADVAVWQREHLTPVFADEIDWWREHLDGLEPLDLPTDRPRPAIFDSAGATVSYDIDAATVDGLRELAQSEGATLFMAMHAVVASLLGRWADQDDLALASPIAGRNHPDMEPLIGFFANTLVLRHDLSGRPTFRELLARVRHVALGVFDHQNLPFERLVEALGVRRDPSSTPVFQAAVVLQNMADRELALPALQGELVEREGGSAKIDLTWYFQEHAGGLRVLMEYRSSIFASGTMGRMVEQLAELMRGVTASPDRQIAELAVLGAAEERRLLEWSGRASRCLGGLVDSVMAQALAVPDAEAVLDTVGGTLTRAELVSRAHALATRLHLHGIGVEEPVVLFCARSLDMVVATVGILGAGCVVVPLDPAYPDDRIAWILEDTGARLAVVDEVGLARLPAASTVERLPLASLAAPASEPVDLGSLTWPGVTGPDHIAHILYTSGSTGRPKGVMVTHANVQQRIVRDPEAADVIGEQTYLQISSPAFDGSTVEIWPPLLGGGRLVMAPPGPLSLDAIGRTVREHQVSMLFFTTSLYNQVVDSQLGALTGVRQLFMGGEAASPTHCQRALDELGATVINGYGPTENTCFTTCHVMRPGDRIPPHTVPIGRAAAGTTIYVLDAHLSPTPIGVPGELYTGGGGLARGYLNRADLTAERFVPDPFASPAGGRLYRTGDKVRWLDDGTLEFLGRVDRQIKLRGYRIEPGEIEAEILAHAAVREAVVTVFGEGAERRLVAYYVLDTGVEVAEDALLEQVKTSLPAYMVPSTFMRLDGLPLTSNGKLDRKALPVPLLERRGDRTAPSTALEASIAEVWRGVLGLDDVGVEESFFDLGGNSLLMVEVHGRLQQTLGARAPSMVELFRLPTIRSLAESLDDAAVAPRLAEVTASTRRSGPVDIAVVGMAARFPGADDLETFWRNLAAGIESVSFYDEETLLAAGVPQATLDNPRYVRARSRIADTDHFDASFFGMSPREAQIVDPQHRMFLETSWSALEDAGYGDTSQPQNVGVWAGAGMPTYLFNVLSNQALAASVGIFQIFLANDKDFLPTRVSYKLNLTGPSLTVQTACSTALVSVSLACDALAAGQCRMALAGGVASKNGGETGYMHETGGISSPDGHTRAFDARGGGTVFGDGVGVVVLKRLDDALADGDHIRAVIRGTALNNDGSAKVGFTAPSIDGQAAVIAQAHAEADVDPRSITYIEAHGTATNLGDPVEVSALTSAFAAHTDETGFCAIGSVKSNFGHLDTAAGAAGLIKTVLALEHKSLPPSLHYETPNPHIDFASSPFFVNTELRDWQPGPDGVRRAGVSSFGMGGTNAHVVLEEAPAATESAATSPGQLLVVSAPTPTALDTITTRLADHLDGLDSLPADADSRRLADVAYTLAVGRRPFNHRRVVVATDTASAVTALRAAAPGRHTDTVRNPVFLFAGQGSQYPGMARDLYAHQPVFREALDGCAEVLERHLGRDLRTVIFADADDASAATTLTDTRFTQPALFAVCWALAELLESWGVVPTAMLGHSLGEWVAATRAGVFDRDDALALVAKRGALMASMQPGSMVSVEATEAELASYLGEELVVAVVNGPRQTVLAGPDEAIDALTEALDADEVQYRRLHTSHAFHSPMMEPMLDEFTAAVAAVERRPPSVPFVSNPSGTWITDDEAVDPQYWARQVREAVRFSDGIATLVEAGHEIFVEIGPGRGLGTLVKQHPSTDRAHQAVATMRRAKSDDADRGVLLAAAGALWTAGVELDWSGVFGIGRKRRPLPTYPFERQRYFVELPRALAAAAGVASRTGAAPATTVSAPTPIAAATSTEYVAPRTDLERDIAALWEEMLGVERVGIHDDYFELGGSSLLAVRLASRLSTQLEREVSPHILLDAPTVAQLATHLEEDGAIETDGATATETTADAPASLLIPLKPGRPEEPPLFMPPPIGGHVFGYRGLAMAMPDEVPVIGIRARGTEPGERSPRSIEAIAREHIAAIRDRQPTGPYRLAGSSLGGMIAWEIAYQLREVGEEVEFLALLDSPGPGQMPARPADDAEFLHHLYGAALGIEVEELRKLDADAQLAYLVEAARSRGGLPPGFDIDAARRYLELLKDLLHAMYTWEARTFDGSAVFFRARQRATHEPDHPELAWIDLASGSVEVHVVPGGHNTMQTGPHLPILAARLRHSLERHTARRATV